MSLKADKPEPAAPGVHPKRWWSFRPASDRQAGDAIVSNFLLHWFPAKSFKASLSWNYSLWLGTVSAALLFLLVLSGLPLLFLYIPSVERAYASVKDIEYVITDILREAFPNEAQDLWAKYTACFLSGQTMLNLQQVVNMSPAIVPK